MAKIDWRERYVLNTTASFLAFGARIVTGFILFGRYVNTLDDASFGFWSVLWSMLAFSTLFEFGLGVAVKRMVARSQTEEASSELSVFFPTAFWTNVAISIVLGCAGWVLTETILDWFQEVSPLRRPEYASAFRVFVVGAVLMMPMGLFSECLLGLQQQALNEFVRVGFMLLSFGASLYALSAGYPLSVLVAIPLFTHILMALVFAILVFQRIKGLSLNPFHWSWLAMKDELGFSLTAYANMVGTVLMRQADRLILGRMLGLATGVTPFQPGRRVGELFTHFSRQSVRAFIPAAAHLHGAGEKEQLKDFYLRVVRLSFIIITPVMMIGLAYMREGIAVLVQGKPMPENVYSLGQILLLGFYLVELFTVGPESIFMMIGKERLPVRALWVRLLLVVIIGIVLTNVFGVIGMAWAMVLAAALSGFAFLLIPTLRELKCGWLDYLHNLTHGTGSAFAVLALILVVLLEFFPTAADGSILPLCWRGAVATVPVYLLLWPHIARTWREKPVV